MKYKIAANKAGAAGNDNIHNLNTPLYTLAIYLLN